MRDSVVIISLELSFKISFCQKCAYYNKIILKIQKNTEVN